MEHTIILIAAIAGGLILGWFGHVILTYVKNKEQFLVGAAQQASQAFITELRSVEQRLATGIKQSENNVTQIARSVGMGVSQRVGDVHEDIKSVANKVGAEVKVIETDLKKV